MWPFGRSWHRAQFTLPLGWAPAAVLGPSSATAMNPNAPRHTATATTSILVRREKKCVPIACMSVVLRVGALLIEPIRDR